MRVNDGELQNFIYKGNISLFYGNILLSLFKIRSYYLYNKMKNYTKLRWAFIFNSYICNKQILISSLLYYYLYKKLY